MPKLELYETADKFQGDNEGTVLWHSNSESFSSLAGTDSPRGSIRSNSMINVLMWS